MKITGDMEAREKIPIHLPYTSLVGNFTSSTDKSGKESTRKISIIISSVRDPTGGA